MEINKNEGLNTKAQISDCRTEARPIRKEKQLGIMDPKVVLFASKSVSSAAFKEKSNISIAFNSLHKGSVVASIVDGGYEPTTVGRVMLKVEETQASSDNIVGERTQFQRRGQALQGRADYRGRGRFSSQENEEWRKKLAGTSTSIMSSKRNVDVSLAVTHKINAILKRSLRRKNQIIQIMQGQNHM